MFDRAYRQRLEADLAQWQADGVITPAAVTAIRLALPPLAPGFNIATVVAIVGGLLIAAAFLAFVAAHWLEIPRLLRLAILFAGIVSAHGLGGWFARAGKPVLADLCASVGSIIFGAGIALVGQMYHLGGDFVGGMLLWAVGALAAAALTGSRGALAVALVAATIWSCMRTDANHVPHFSFTVIWLIAAGLTLAWNARVAAHLVALSVFPWWFVAALHPVSDHSFSPMARHCCLAAASHLPRRLGGGLLPPGSFCRPTALLRWPEPPHSRSQRLTTFSALTGQAIRFGRSRAASRERFSLLRLPQQRAGQVRPLPRAL